MGYGGSWNSGYSRTSAASRYQSEVEESKQQVEDSRQKFDKAISEIETKRCNTAESLVNLGLLRVKTWLLIMPMFAQAFKNISLESIKKISFDERVPSSDWEPKRFLETVEKSASLIDELVSVSNKEMDGGDLVSISAFGGPVLFCSPMPEEILATINEIKQKNGAVAWFSGLANPDNYDKVVSRFVLSGVDVLPFLGLETKRAEKYFKKMTPFMSDSDLIDLSDEVDKVTAKLLSIGQEIDYINTVTGQALSLTENLKMYLSQLVKDVSKIDKEYHDVTTVDKIMVENLSEMEQKTVAAAWEIGQKLVDLLVLPIMIETGGVSPDAQGYLNIDASKCNILCNSVKYLLWEKEEIARLLKKSKEYVPSLKKEYKEAKEKTKESLLQFAKYKFEKFNVEFKDYFSVLNRVEELQLEPGILGLPEICEFNSNKLKQLSLLVNRIANSEEPVMECTTILFAVNSLELGKENNTLYRWLTAENSGKSKVDGVGEEEFKNARAVVKKITGKENLKTAKSLYEDVVDKCQGIQSVISKMNSLISLLMVYEETMDLISNQLRPIADRVAIIGSAYDGTVITDLTSQEKKIISVSWEYGQLLFQMLTDVFYDDEKESFTLCEERPLEVKERFKPLRQALFKLRGENAYAADSLWKRSAERAKLVSFALVILLVIAGIVSSCIWNIKGLLFLMDACIALPVFFVKKDMPLNQVTFWRWTRAAGAVFIAIAIIFIMIV